MILLADASLLWLELLAVGTPGVRGKNYESLLREADELTAVFSASYRTAKANLEKQKRNESPNHEISKSPNLFRPHRVADTARRRRRRDP